LTGRRLAVGWLAVGWLFAGCLLAGWLLAGLSAGLLLACCCVRTAEPRLRWQFHVRFCFKKKRPMRKLQPKS
jgi:hypothetical protein